MNAFGSIVAEKEVGCPKEFAVFAMLFFKCLLFPIEI